ncbi:PAS domain-containing protein, partial [Candidatus Aerophobetes bacterium]|nr:PAS domain-containing protein [Candidatus Aerophobetes bacterium]
KTQLQTELERKEQELRELEETVKQIFKNLPLPMHLMYVDKEYRIRYVSEELAKYRGFERAEQVIGLKTTDLFPKKGGEAINAVIDTGKPIDHEEMVLGKKVDGRKVEVPILASCRPIYDARGEIVGAVPAFTEITEVKETQLLNVINNLPIPCFVVNKEDRTIQAMNQACAELTGFSVDEVVGKMKGPQVFSPHTTTCNICDQMAPTMDNAQAKVGVRTSFINRNKEEIPVELTTVPLYDNRGNVTGGFGLLQDLRAETKAAEEIRRVVQEINKGNIEERVNTELLTGEFTEIGKSVNEITDAIREPLNEINMLTDAASEGKLDIRGDVEKFKGAFAEIIQGINNTLDAVVEPVKEVEAVMKRMADNDFTTPVKGEYKGEYELLAKVTNEVRARLLRVQEIVQNIAAGDLTDLDELKQIGRRSENDNLIPSFIRMMESIKGLVAEAGMLAEAAVEGKLDTRGDASKFEGDFAGVVQGINDMLEAVVEPVREVMRVCNALAEGNLSARIEIEA